MYKGIFFLVRRGIRSVLLFSAIIFVSFFSFAYTTHAIDVAECKLQEGVYRTQQSAAVYYVTDGCRKRVFKNAATYFTHKDSWDDVEITNEVNLNSLQFASPEAMQFGPLWNETNGAIVKSPLDPRVYLLLGNTKHWVKYEWVVTSLFGQDGFTLIEDVEPELLEQFEEGEEIDGEKLPLSILVKEEQNPKVYKITESEENSQVRQKKWIINQNDEDYLSYRKDRIGFLFLTEYALAPEPSNAFPLNDQDARYILAEDEILYIKDNEVAGRAAISPESIEEEVSQYKQQVFLHRDVQVEGGFKEVTVSDYSICVGPGCGGLEEYKNTYLVINVLSILSPVFPLDDESAEYTLHRKTNQGFDWDLKYDNGVDYPTYISIVPRPESGEDVDDMRYDPELQYNMFYPYKEKNILVEAESVVYNEFTYLLVDAITVKEDGEEE